MKFLLHFNDWLYLIKLFACIFVFKKGSDVFVQTLGSSLLLTQIHPILIKRRLQYILGANPNRQANTSRRFSNLQRNAFCKECIFLNLLNIFLTCLSFEGPKKGHIIYFINIRVNL